MLGIILLLVLLSSGCAHVHKEFCEKDFHTCNPYSSVWAEQPQNGEVMKYTSGGTWACFKEYPCNKTIFWWQKGYR